MPLYIRDEEVNQLAAQVQAVLGAPTKTAALRTVLRRALEEQERKTSFLGRLQEIQARARALGTPDPNFDDKAYFDVVFLETSAIVQLVLNGPQADGVARAARAAKTPFLIGPTVEFEATLVLASRLQTSLTPRLRWFAMLPRMQKRGA